jgi:hypothetical protein
MLENGLDKCSCVVKRCVRYGDCARCIEHHRTKSKKYPLPYCKRDRGKRKLNDSGTGV